MTRNNETRNFITLPNDQTGDNSTNLKIKFELYAKIKLKVCTMFFFLHRIFLKNNIGKFVASYNFVFFSSFSCSSFLIINIRKQSKHILHFFFYVVSLCCIETTIESTTTIRDQREYHLLNLSSTPFNSSPLWNSIHIVPMYWQLEACSSCRGC